MEIYHFLSRSLIDTTPAEGERVAMATASIIRGCGARQPLLNKDDLCRPRSHTIGRQSPSDDEQEALHLFYLLHNLRLLLHSSSEVQKSAKKTPVIKYFRSSSPIKSLFFSFLAFVK